MSNRSLVAGLVLFLCVIMIGAAAAAAGAEASLPDLANATWLLLGPFPVPADDMQPCQGFARDYLAGAGGEAAAQPKAGGKAAGLIWNTYKAKAGTVDFLAAYPGTVNSVAYAYLEFNSPRNQEAALRLGSDDGIQVWCNGRQVWFNHIHRAVTPGEDAIRLALQAGKNRLLCKVDQAMGDWGLSAALGTIVQEEQRWKAAVPGLQIMVNTPAVPAGGQVQFTVVTVPMLAVAEPVDIALTDSQGRNLGRASGFTGQPCMVALPRDFSGLIRFEAAGTGARSWLKADVAYAVAGDEAAIIRAASASARELAARQPAAGGEDLGAVLAFQADQAEGRLHTSLNTHDRVLRALAEIEEIKRVLRNGITWQPWALRGLRQRAYRSWIDGSLQPYTIYLPPSYDPKRRYSLLLCLHGYSNNDYDTTKKLADLRPEDFIIAGPYGRGDMGYRATGEQDVLDMLDLMQRLYNVDPDRVYLTGISMGGMGTWRLGQLFPDRFAAVAPFCGWTGTQYLGNLRNLPALIVHGGADTTVPCGMDREAAATMKAMGFPVRYDELPGAGHGAWEAWSQALGGETLFEYFRGFSRNIWPRQVDITLSHLRYGRQYWARIDEKAPMPGTCRLTAEIAGGSSLTVQTENVIAFSLDLRHPLLAQKGEIAVEIAGKRLLAQAGREASFALESGSWTIDHAVLPAATVRHDGGGFGDLFYGPVIFVYGTADAKRAAVLRRTAEMLTDWSPTAQIPLGSKLGHFVVKADTDVTEAELHAASLLLLGSPAENRLTARLAGALPARFTGEGVEVGGKNLPGYGLALVCPNPEAPARLLGLIALPFPAEAMEQFARSAALPLYTYYTNGSAIDCYTTPDVMAVPAAPDAVQYNWRFDRLWQRLLPYGG